MNGSSQTPSSALNITLPAFAAERRAAAPLPLNDDRHFLPTERSAPNPPAAVDRRDRQTDGRTDRRTDARPLHRLCGAYTLVSSCVQVYVTDVNDHAPQISVEALSSIEGRATTPEAAAVGSFVAHVVVRDADAGANGRVSCRLDGPDADLFRLQPVSAAVTPPVCLQPYDTIRDAILTCARKPTWVSLIYRTEPTTKKCKNRKTKSRKQICSEITVNSPGNPCSEYLRRRNEGLQWEGFAEKEGFKPGVKE